MTILYSLIWADRGSNLWSPALHVNHCTTDARIWSFDCERTWWRSFQKHFVSNKFDILWKHYNCFIKTTKFNEHTNPGSLLETRKLASKNDSTFTVCVFTTNLNRNIFHRAVLSFMLLIDFSRDLILIVLYILSLYAFVYQ